jgi:hypothetical protein
MVNNDQKPCLVSLQQDHTCTMVMAKYRLLWQHFPLHSSSRTRLPKISRATKSRGQILLKACSLHLIVPHKMSMDTGWIPTRHDTK